MMDLQKSLKNHCKFQNRSSATTVPGLKQRHLYAPTKSLELNIRFVSPRRACDLNHNLVSQDKSISLYRQRLRSTTVQPVHLDGRSYGEDSGSLMGCLLLGCLKIRPDSGCRDVVCHLG
ncbi:hypothetical protein YC2023_087687 [Brassica napus]